MSVVALSSAGVLDAWPTARLLPRAIRAQHDPGGLIGPAYPVSHRADDNLALHRAVCHAPAGSILVSATGGRGAVGVWGAVLTDAAMTRGLLGFVTEACVRDIDEIAATSFAIHAAGRDPRKARKRDRGTLGRPVRIGAVDVAVGDVIVADGDGVVVVRRAEAEAAIEAARSLARCENELRNRIRAGASTLELLGLGTASDPEPEREEAR